jgi:hypothetical protein
MKLSKQTREVLANFGKYNTSIDFYQGNIQSIRTPRGNIAIVSELKEYFQANSTLDNLAGLNKILAIHTNPDIEFTEEELVVYEGRHSTRFPITTHQLELKDLSSIKFPDQNLIFDHKTYEKMVKISQAIKPKVKKLSTNTKSPRPYLAFYSQNNEVKADIYYDTNEFDVRQTTYIGKGSFEWRTKIYLEDLKPLPGTYSLWVSEKSVKLYSKSNKTNIYVCGK